MDNIPPKSCLPETSENDVIGNNAFINVNSISKTKSSLGLGKTKKAATSIYIRRRRNIEMQRRRPSPDVGRNWREVSQVWKCYKEMKSNSLLELLERVWFCKKLNFGLLAS